MIGVKWQSSICTENFMISSSNFEPKFQGLLQFFEIYVSADHLGKVIWKVQPYVSRFSIAPYGLSIIQRIPIILASFRQIETERLDRISKCNAELSLPVCICIQYAMFIQIYEFCLETFVQSDWTWFVPTAPFSVPSWSGLHNHGLFQGDSPRKIRSYLET
jgi:hypothetical protein